MGPRRFEVPRRAESSSDHAEAHALFSLILPVQRPAGKPCSEAEEKDDDAETEDPLPVVDPAAAHVVIFTVAVRLRKRAGEGLE